MPQLTGLTLNVLGSAPIFLFSPTSPGDYYGSIDMPSAPHPQTLLASSL